MSEETFEQLLNASFKTIHTGEVVEGTVIDVKPDEIILNIGYKSDGILTKNEYSNDNSIDLTTPGMSGTENRPRRRSGSMPANMKIGEMELSHSEMF